MKQLRSLLSLAGCLILLAVLTGCETPGGVPASEGALTARPDPAQSAPNHGSDTLQVGEKVTMEFTDTTAAIPPISQVVREDGTISVPFNLKVAAAGKTKGQLAAEVRDLLVPKYYREITVIIKTEDRVFFVGGEVKRPDRVVYVGEITVTKAIKAAGDFTDFANKRKVLLVRLNGQKFIVNCKKAQDDPRLDLPVYPGDTITVPRSLY